RFQNKWRPLIRFGNAMNQALRASVLMESKQTLQKGCGGIGCGGGVGPGTGSGVGMGSGNGSGRGPGRGGVAISNLIETPSLPVGVAGDGALLPVVGKRLVAFLVFVVVVFLGQRAVRTPVQV